MRTIRTKVYQFSELSKQAKQTAVENNAANCEYFWGDDAIKSLQGFAEHFNCELKDWSIDWTEGYRNTVYFSIPDYVKDWTEDEIKQAIIGMGTYDKKTLRGDGECKFTGFCMDEDAADGARAVYFEGERDIYNILMAGYERWYKACQNDYIDQLSPEQYAEHCEANEYEFKADGTRF